MLVRRSVAEHGYRILGFCAKFSEGVPDGLANLLVPALHGAEEWGDMLPFPGPEYPQGFRCRPPDGQVLVFHDVAGLEDRVLPKFVRRYGSLKADGVAAVAAFAADVRAGRFPSDTESYHLPDGVALEDEDIVRIYGEGAAAR